jgi:predicted N-acetyltransferase YhbS
MNEATRVDNDIRPEQKADEPAIRRVLEAAFARSAEADLVEQLRTDNALLLGLVARGRRV